MVLTDSPYHSCKAVKWDEGMALRNSQDWENSFEW